jgi:crotonobetainyl-CoA:carnitine CoA-transferase CaiB-like acyl-CoA transferase
MSTDSAASGPAAGPLAGVRVVEVSTGRAGRIAGMLLADLGADVVTVVTPGRPSGQPQPADVCWDRGKRLLAAADADARRLATDADVLLVNATAAEAADRGLTSVRLRQAAPAVVHVWLPPYGEAGEWRDLSDDPLFLAALTSLAVHLPADDDSPVAPVVSALSSIHGALGAAAAVAGLVGRSRSGRAQPAVVTGLHAGAALMGTAFTEINDAPAFAPSRGTVPAPNWRTYACADGKRIFLAALTPELFFRALEAIGRLDVMALPEVGGDFQSILDLKRGRPAVTAALEPVLAELTSDEWIERFRAARVPCALVQTRAEWIDGPVVADNGARLTLHHEDLGDVVMPGVPIGFSLTPGRVRGFAAAASGRPQWASRTPSAPPAVAPAAAAPSLAEPPAQPAAALPLDGLRVLDVSSFLAGPLAAAVLADFGADVIRVEPPAGDGYRNYPLSFLAVNQRKRGIALDLSDPGSGKILQTLLDGMDVLVENMRPAARARLDLAGTASRHPQLVHCSLSAFGDAERWADVPGFDPILQSLNGMARAQGGAGDPVVGSAGVNDTATAALSALGILAALYWRVQAGTGQRVRTSLAVGSTFVQAAEYTTWDGAPAPLQGGALFRGPGDGHRYYQCADGWIAVAGGAAPGGAAALLGALAVPDFPAAERALGDLPVAAATGLLARHEVPACRVVARPRPLRDAFLEDNGFTHLVSMPEGTGRVVDRHSRWPDAPGPRQSRYFEIGADTAAVLAEFGLPGGE